MKRRARVSDIVQVESECVKIFFRTTDEREVESMPMRKDSEELAEAISGIWGKEISLSTIEGMSVSELHRRIVGKMCLIEFEPTHFLKGFGELPDNETEEQKEKRWSIEDFCKQNFIDYHSDGQVSFYESLLDEHSETIQEALNIAYRKIQSTGVRPFSLKGLVDQCKVINERDRIEREETEKQLRFQRAELEADRADQKNFFQWWEKYMDTDEYWASRKEGERLLEHLRTK